MLAACALPLLWTAWFEHGVFWPDEIFQTLEQGHRFAFGYGLVPWEFRDGVRSWAVPGAMGLIMKAGSLAGMHAGLTLARLVRVCVAAGTIAGSYATMRMAEHLSRRISGETAALPAAVLAGALYASSPFLIYFGSRCFTDTVSIPFVAFGAQQLLSVTDRDGREKRAAATAGMLLGLAVVVRYQNVLFLGAAFGVVAATRSWRALVAFMAGALVPLVAGGILDWITWGAPYAPLVRYAARNAAGGTPGQFPRPVSYYAVAAWRGLGWPCLLLLAGTVVAARRSREPLALAAAYLVFHCLVSNKQERFILPVIPLVLGVGAAGLVALVRRVTQDYAARWSVAFLAILVAAVVGTSAQRLADATFDSMGREGMKASAWHYKEDATQALVLVGASPDVCGVMIRIDDWYYTGAYTYLHRNVPFFHGVDPEHVANANYIVAPRGSHVPAGYDPTAVHDTYAVYRRDGPCATPSAYSWNSER